MKAFPKYQSPDLQALFNYVEISLAVFILPSVDPQGVRALYKLKRCVQNL